ncbi:hypothetical protein [Owenweeksia hongkongensis]|uniref:hypothetical protein n=1 Tax=Owenweeksia hongkongensis TaxID=253245 RepID=UPI003A8F1742
MKKLEFYKIGLITMVVLNLALVSFLVFNNPQSHSHSHDREDGHFRKRAIQILDLDKEQLKQFKDLATLHHMEMIKMEDQQKELLRPYFNQLSTGDGVLNEDSRRKVSELDRQKLELTYNHFKEVKAILRPNQYPNFEIFLSQAIDELLMDEKSSPPPPHLRRNHK